MYTVPKFQIITPSRDDIERRGDDQCDCACSTPTLPCPAPHNLSTTVVRNSMLEAIQISDEHHAAFVPSSERVVVVSDDVLALLDFFSTPVNLEHELVNLPIDYRASKDLNATLDQLYQQHFLIDPTTQPVQTLPAIKPDTLIVWLHTTNECNLRCVYCYLDKTNEFMSLETGRAAIEAAFRSAISHGFSAIKFKYAGGEPTLNLPLVIALHSYAIQLSKQHKLNLDGVILSNGVGLTSSMMDEIQSVHLRLMISLDGIGTPHDRQRVFVNGAGSFKAVEHTIDRALAKGLVPDISITVTERNADGLADVITWVLERNLPFSVNFYRDNDASTAYTDLALTEERIIRGMKSAFRVIEEKLPDRSLLSALLDRANLSAAHSHTCGVGSNYMVIDHYGRVSKCQMQIGHSITDVHAEDPLALVVLDQKGIQNLHVEQKSGCKTCEWRYWCTGGCPLATYRATGRYDVKSPNCNIYKSLYPEALRLEGLRLLKYSKLTA